MAGVRCSARLGGSAKGDDVVRLGWTRLTRERHQDDAEASGLNTDTYRIDPVELPAFACLISSPATQDIVLLPTPWPHCP